MKSFFLDSIFLFLVFISQVILNFLFIQFDFKIYFFESIAILFIVIKTNINLIYFLPYGFMFDLIFNHGLGTSSFQIFFCGSILRQFSKVSLIEKGTFIYKNLFLLFSFLFFGITRLCCFLIYDYNIDISLFCYEYLRNVFFISLIFFLLDKLYSFFSSKKNNT